MARWKKAEVLERINKYTNKELLEETIDASVGDDYDGGFTSYGEFEFRELKKELHLRLAEWLKEK